METMMILAGAGAVLGLAAGVFLFLRLRSPREEPTYHFRCPGCNRRLRYQRRQVGHKGQCSNCRRDLIFPPVVRAVK